MAIVLLALLAILSATSLQSVLDDANIRMNVIVISACYSGNFIEPLANEQAIVLTASSRTRTSFGCSDDRHLEGFTPSRPQSHFGLAAEPGVDALLAKKGPAPDR